MTSQVRTDAEPPNIKCTFAHTKIKRLWFILEFEQVCCYKVLSRARMLVSVARYRAHNKCFVHGPARDADDGGNGDGNNADTMFTDICTMHKNISEEYG